LDSLLKPKDKKGRKRADIDREEGEGFIDDDMEEAFLKQNDSDAEVARLFEGEEEGDDEDFKSGDEDDVDFKGDEENKEESERKREKKHRNKDKKKHKKKDKKDKKEKKKHKRLQRERRDVEDEGNTEG
jgi:hypothetical protein